MVFISGSVIVRCGPFEFDDQRVQLDHNAMVVQLIEGDLPGHLRRQRSDVGVKGSLGHRHSD